MKVTLVDHNNKPVKPDKDGKYRVRFDRDDSPPKRYVWDKKTKWWKEVK